MSFKIKGNQLVLFFHTIADINFKFNFVNSLKRTENNAFL
jgi:hypothetical protein